MNHYWSTSDDVQVKPIVGVMRGRFMKILAYVNDNTEISKDNPDKNQKQITQAKASY
jgi:hypothetical protein